MGRRIRITAIKKKEPVVGLYVQALITYVRELQAAKDQQRKPEPEATTDDATTKEPKEADHDGD